MATLASNGILYGNGTAAVQALAVNSTATNKFLTQSSSGAPAWNTIAASDLPGSFNGFANPSATIGLSAVNGSAATAMRSDAAPALSQSITPTWTGLHIFSAGATSTQLSVTSKAYFGGTATSTFDSAGNLSVAGTANVTGKTTLGAASSTNLTASASLYTPITSALLLADSNNLTTAYTGSTCTNQFVRSLNGSGVATCASVSLSADVTGTLGIANGGTATTTKGITNGVVYNNGTNWTNSSNFIFDGTNVGIGTTTPQQKLSVVVGNLSSSGVTGFTIDGTYNTAGQFSSIDFTDAGNTSVKPVRIGAILAADTAGGELGFYTSTNVTNTNGTERMRIDKNGNVGIGTTAPGAALSVANTASIVSLRPGPPCRVSFGCENCPYGQS